MNLRDEILREYSKKHALRIAEYACSSKGNFAELMKCFLDDEYRLAQRAAWSVSWAARKNPEIVKPHLKVIVDQLERKEVHSAVVRNCVRVLEGIDIPEKLHGEVMNVCFHFIENPSTPVAVKAFSLTVLHKLSKYYPEIKQELKVIIEERMETETAAFKSRGKKILSDIG
jgi:hypothetical protein